MSDHTSSISEIIDLKRANILLRLQNQELKKKIDAMNAAYKVGENSETSPRRDGDVNYLVEIDKQPDGRRFIELYSKLLLFRKRASIYTKALEQTRSQVEEMKELYKYM